MEVFLLNVNPVCDFCSKQEVAVAYLVEDFVLPEYAWGSTGAFAACSECRELVEADKKRELEDRAFWSFKFYRPVEEIPDEYIRTFIRRLHAEFWSRLRKKQPPSRTDIQECVHHLGNELQKVFGYIEIDQCEKAKPFVRIALKHLRELHDILHRQ